MKVLILGASGFVGFPTCVAFCRAGHIVYGQTRSASSAQKLAEREIVPVICDPLTDQGRAVWGEIAARVDVVIDLLVITGPQDTLATYRQFAASVASRPRGGAKPTYIFAEGHWTLTSGLGGLEAWTDERQPQTEFNALTRWHAEVEREIFSNKDIHAIAIHPPMVYGGSGSWYATYIFEPALAASKTETKVFETIWQEGARLTTVHRDDLADLILRVAERAPICHGQAFMGANPQSESMRDIIDAVVRVSGLVAQAWVSTTLQKPSLGAALVGWFPRRMGLVDGMDVYWRSFLASKGGSEVLAPEA